NKGGSRFEDDNEQFWAAIINNDYSSISSTVQFQHTLVSKLRSGIHPSRMRGQVWQALSRSSLLHLDTLYAQLKDEPTSYEALIRRDIHRTFPNTDMFSQESGQRALERILRAYSLYDTDVGYCQGLAFLVGPLLLNAKETFCVLIRLMETYGMRTLFTLDMEGLHLRLFQLDVLLLEFLPNLHHFLNTIHEIHPQMYASHWFLTVFAYNFPLPLVYRIYDIMFAEGPIETVLRLALTLLKKSLAEIMALTEFEDIMDYLSVKLIDPYNGNYDLMIEEAMAFGELVTKKKLDAIEKKFSA
ncbi:MAG: rab-GTPase-TBC domain-containing protein, partial [Benjaminiella poitrasii]